MLKVANSVISASQIATPITFAGDVTLSTGNLVIGTAGKGIDFSATSSGSGTMTSELLADYEEGTWTPTQGAGLTVVGAFTSSGFYTKIGRQVFATGRITAATSITTASGTIMVGGLPFTVNASASANGFGTAINGAYNASSPVVADAGGTDIYSVSVISATTNIFFSATYIV